MATASTSELLCFLLLKHVWGQQTELPTTCWNQSIFPQDIGYFIFELTLLSSVFMIFSLSAAEKIGEDIEAPDDDEEDDEDDDDDDDEEE